MMSKMIKFGVLSEKMSALLDQVLIETFPVLEIEKEEDTGVAEKFKFVSIILKILVD